MRVGDFELFTEFNVLGVPTDHGLPIGQGPGNALVWTAAPIDGQVLIGSTGADPVLNTLTAGANVSISNGSGSITISAGGATGISWQTVTGNQMLAVNNGYICVGGGILNLSLPSTGTLGDIIEVVLDGSTGWVITQTVTSQIILGNLITSPGGTISSSAQGDAVRMVCQTANRWNVLSGMGNILIT